MANATRHRSRSEPAAPVLTREHDCFVGRFTAMASPCEVLVDSDDRALAESLAQIAAAEAARIERTFSRYRPGNIVDRINRAGGRPVPVDPETASLLNYAATCHEVSGGRFDITSGALRRVWTFDGGDRVPKRSAVRDVQQHVGWHRVRWEGGTLAMPEGMEIDLGGIGKEYAVDQAARLMAATADVPMLVNFGGDLFANRARGTRGTPPQGGVHHGSSARSWCVGVDDPCRTGEGAVLRLELSAGGLATSGDARRFVRWRGRRLGHILDPRTGWPVADAPRSVTVLAATCLEAGTMSTLAALRGRGARPFLEDSGLPHWIVD